MGTNNTYALSFDGTNDVVTVALASSVLYEGDKTIELWVRPTGGQSTKGIISIASSPTSSSPWILLQRENSTTVRWFVNGNYRISQTVADDEFTHLALTHDGTIWRSYKNGVAGATYTGTDGGTAGTTTYFGSGYNGYFGGILDEIRIWTAARTQPQIEDNMNRILTGSESNLIAYWRFSEGTDTTANDSAGSYDGTINGASWTTTTPDLLSSTTTGAAFFLNFI